MEKDVLVCSICGADSTEKVINVHSAMSFPGSFGYCESCDKNGFITFFELIKFMSNPNKKEWIVENIDFIIENCQAINKGLWHPNYHNRIKFDI